MRPRDSRWFEFSKYALDVKEMMPSFVGDTSGEVEDSSFIAVATDSEPRPLVYSDLSKAPADRKRLPIDRIQDDFDVVFVVPEL